MRVRFEIDQLQLQHYLGDVAEDNVFTVQPGSLRGAEKELQNRVTING